MNTISFQFVTIVPGHCVPVTTPSRFVSCINRSHMFYESLENRYSSPITTFPIAYRGHADFTLTWDHLSVVSCFSVKFLSCVFSRWTKTLYRKIGGADEIVFHNILWNCGEFDRHIDR